LSQSDREKNPDVKGLDQTADAFPAIEISGQYQDVRGKSYAIQQTLELRTRWDEAKGSRRLAAYRGPLLPFYELVQSIKKALEHIASDRLSGGTERHIWTALASWV
jgi:hypothetical protein